jgi:AcrR family transcriptional regulator
MDSLLPESDLPDRRSRILEVAAELFASTGFRSTSMSDVATAAGIQKPSLYHHFASKDQILFHVLDEGISRLLTEAERVAAENPNPRDRLERLLFAHINGFETKRSQVTVFLLERQSALGVSREQYLTKRRRYDQIFVRTVAEGQRQGVFRDGDPTVMTFGIRLAGPRVRQNPSRGPIVRPCPAILGRIVRHPSFEIESLY